MIKLKYIFFILFISQINIFCEEFIKKGLFSFNYPEDKLEVYDLTKGEPKRSKEKMHCYLNIDDINSDLYDGIIFFYKADIIQERENLLKGKLNEKEHIGLVQPAIVKINNTYGKRYIILDKPMYSLFFQLSLVFYVKNYRIILTLDADIHQDKIILENRECYRKIEQIDSFGDTVVYYVLDVENKNYKDIFYNNLFDSNKPTTYNWNKTFEEVIQSIRIDSTYYTSTINNLRFRKSPDLKGGFIRMLKKGERLELLEKGKEETIKCDKGTWIKVITNKSEIGWCFDAYLERIK